MNDFSIGLVTVIDEENGTTLMDAIVERAIDNGSRDVATVSREAIATVAKSVVTEKVTGFVTEILSKPFIETDRYGNPIKEPTSWHEFVEKKIHEYLNEKVDARGKVEYTDRPFTRVAWIINESVKAAIDKELTAAIADAKAAFKREMGSKLSLAFRQVMAEAAKE